jgi:hypothetical protein
VEVLNEIFQAVTLESLVGWPKHGYGKRKSDLVAIDKCLATSPDMKVIFFYLRVSDTSALTHNNT